MTGLSSLASLLFGFQARVTRRSYILAGVVLMLFKYEVEYLVVRIATGNDLPALTYLSPLVTHRLPSALPPLDVGLLAIFSLPFLWVGVSMSVRRAEEIGLSAWVGALFLVPWLNYLLILVLAVTPARLDIELRPEAQRPISPARNELLPALAGVVSAAAIGVLGAIIIGQANNRYGYSLFFLLPFAMGACSAFALNRVHRRTLRRTLLVAELSLLLAAGGMLVFAVEGGVCLLMAAPIGALAVAIGAIFGREIARRSPARMGAAMLVMLPAGAVFERPDTQAPVYEVTTSVEVNAPPEVVWRHVIQFPELDAPLDLAARMGIAYPLRAHIEGQGVGAVRFCEFSTGPFVEPITRWDAPHRLSFDVTAQPPILSEWSPYPSLHPPHLDSSIRSQHGEFRLIALPGGRTRLEGSTWYQLGLEPASYWRLWTDPILHGIHRRVLEHVKALSERDT